MSSLLALSLVESWIFNPQCKSKQSKCKALWPKGPKLVISNFTSVQCLWCGLTGPRCPTASYEEASRMHPNGIWISIGSMHLDLLEESLKSIHTFNRWTQRSRPSTALQWSVTCAFYQSAYLRPLVGPKSKQATIAHRKKAVTVTVTIAVSALLQPSSHPAPPALRVFQVDPIFGDCGKKVTKVSRYQMKSCLQYSSDSMLVSQIDPHCHEFEKLPDAVWCSTTPITQHRFARTSILQGFHIALVCLMAIVCNFISKSTTFKSQFATKCFRIAAGNTSAA